MSRDKDKFTTGSRAGSMQKQGADSAYEDMMNLPHHVSMTRPHMPVQDRAAQFAPFAALTGYDGQVRETARLTDERIELDEYSKEELNRRLLLLERQLAEEKTHAVEADGQAEHENGKAVFTFFRPDKEKAGGAYVTVSGQLKKIDRYAGSVILQDDTRIPLDDLIEIEGIIQ